MKKYWRTPQEGTPSLSPGSPLCRDISAERSPT